MSQASSVILERFRTSYGQDIDLTLRPAYRDLLAKLGNPQDHLPPVFHVAGTNGKGSTCAFLRAMLEAAGYRVHVYTSPHLVTFYERIRISGELIKEDELASILMECEAYALPGGVSYFEAATIAAFVAFTRRPADFTILETGLGGRLDATNIVKKPMATLITRISYDHREYLGDTIQQIAKEKAGIMRSGVPSFVAAQPSQEAALTLSSAAQTLGAPLFVGGIDWSVEEQKEGFLFKDATRFLELPTPSLLGAHQYLNAGLAIAATSVLPKPLSASEIALGLKNVDWPARLQRLTTGSLVKELKEGTELWLDGGHNDSAGEVLAAQIKKWRLEEGADSKPFYVILGMLTTKNPAEFLQPFSKEIRSLVTISIPNEPLSYQALDLAGKAKALGLQAEEALSLKEAVQILVQREKGPLRILICGSLYLAGIVLGLKE